MADSLPAFAPFPSAALRDHIPPDEWIACLDSWVTLVDGHLSLSESKSSASLKDESLPVFLALFVEETARGGANVLGSSPAARKLLKDSYLLIARLLQQNAPPRGLVQWEFLSDLSHLYGKKRAEVVLSSLSKASQASLDSSLASLKKDLIKDLDAGINGDLKAVEERLDRINHLIHVSPQTAEFFLAGSDFLDGLINCYKVMNPPLRKAIISMTYLCLIGLVGDQSPKFSMLTDQLYSLKAAAESHKAGPLNANDSLVAELVTATPLIQQVEHKLEAAGSSTTRAKGILKDLAAFRKPGGMQKPKRFIKRKIDKGKRVELVDHSAIQHEMHVHRMSQITQVQDLFPELGSGFVSKLLDEYEDDNEQVIAHLLDNSLPAHLQDADRSEGLDTAEPPRDLAPRPTPPQMPTRRNVFDNDELDRLDMDVSKLHIGKRGADRTADDVLADRSTAPNKAAILSALAAFDSDDDERDDTYDAEDVGGTVDAAAEDLSEGSEETLFRAFQSNPKLFDRDQATRKAATRTRLKDETGMTDEAIEGWALMLSRNPAQRKRLEARYSQWSGEQVELASTAWRANADSGAEDSEADANRPAFRGGRGRGRGHGRGGGRGGGDVAGPTGEQTTETARRRKEASKGSRANHNRRDQRARKMARGGFPG
ncbi:hypothetical protein GQ53DRAFT_807221 [Thozetella sp. PMI_491]|nr:hypothetical protein GQ53DRAFT_807221 [Thozetella sp. PMI_491]